MQMSMTGSYLAVSIRKQTTGLFCNFVNFSLNYIMMGVGSGQARRGTISPPNPPASKVWEFLGSQHTACFVKFNKDPVRTTPNKVRHDLLKGPWGWGACDGDAV